MPADQHERIFERFVRLPSAGAEVRLWKEPGLASPSSASLSSYTVARFARRPVRAKEDCGWSLNSLWLARNRCRCCLRHPQSRDLWPVIRR